jgi:hypothetical protein
LRAVEGRGIDVGGGREIRGEEAAVSGVVAMSRLWLVTAQDVAGVDGADGGGTGG